MKFHHYQSATKNVWTCTHRYKKKGEIFWIPLKIANSQTRNSLTSRSPKLTFKSSTIYSKIWEKSVHLKRKYSINLSQSKIKRLIIDLAPRMEHKTKTLTKCYSRKSHSFYNCSRKDPPYQQPSTSNLYVTSLL